MRYRMTVRMVCAVAVLGGLWWGTLASAQDEVEDRSGSQESGALFVMTNATDSVRGNEIAMYRRDAWGDLSLIGYFPTGPLDETDPQLGSGPAPTAQIFKLATNGVLPLVVAAGDGIGSSNSLVLSQDNRCLFAVNAGSNTVSSFRVRTNGLRRVSVADSRGVFPASIAVHGDVLYVLNSGNNGSLAGFRVHNCALRPLDPHHPDAVLSLQGISDSFPVPAPNEVLTSPAQIQFTPNGRRLVLSVKGVEGAAFSPQGQLQSLPNGRMVVFPVQSGGQLGTPRVTPFSFAGGTGGPFSFVFIDSRTLIIVHANSGTVGSFTIRDDHTLVLTNNQAPLSTGAFAPCWLDTNGRFVYTASFGAPSGVLEIIGAGAGQPDLNGMLTGFRVRRDGTLSPLGVTVPYPTPRDGTGNHAIDVRVIGNFLYFIQPRTGMIGRLTIQGDGRLTNMEHFGGLTPGLEPFAGNNPGINGFLERCFLSDNESPECLQGSAQGIAGF